MFLREFLDQELVFCHYLRLQMAVWKCHGETFEEDYLMGENFDFSHFQVFAIFCLNLVGL